MVLHWQRWAGWQANGLSEDWAQWWGGGRGRQGKGWGAGAEPGRLPLASHVGRKGDCNMGLFHSGINHSKMGLPWGSSSFPAIAVLVLHTQSWQGASTGSWAGWKLTPQVKNDESSDKAAPLPSHRVVALVPVLVPEVGDREHGCSPKWCQTEVQQSCVPGWKAPWKTPGSWLTSSFLVHPMCSVLPKGCSVLKGHRYVNKSNGWGLFPWP